MQTQTFNVEYQRKRKLRALSPSKPEHFELLAMIAANPKISLEFAARRLNIRLETADCLIRSTAGKQFCIWLKQKPPEMVSQLLFDDKLKMK